MKLADIGADSKLLGCLGLFAAVALLAIACLAIGQVAIDGELERTIAASAADARGVEELYDRFQDLARERWKGFADVGAEAKSKTIEGLDADARDAVALFDAAVRAAPGLAARIERARQSFARLSRSDEVRTKPGDAGGLDATMVRPVAPAAQGDGSMMEMRALRDDIAETIRGRCEKAAAKAKGARTRLVEALAAGLLAALVVTFAALRLALNVPIQALANALRAVSPSSAPAPLPGVGRMDEAGRIARSIEAARAAISAERNAEADRVARVQQSEAHSRAAETRKAAEEAAHTLIRLGAALKTLAGGDLTVRLGDSLSSDGAELARRFDAAIDPLTKAARAFALSADAIRSKARDISAASNDLTQRGEQQFRDLAEASAPLSAIAAKSNDAAERVALTLRHAAALEEEAEKSAGRTRQAAEYWDAVARSAEQVSGMTALVDEVAFQTTLLALNASVEAARAGDVGRGISVVALELRALAQRSTQAAREFDAAFSASSAQIRKGAALMAETGDSMDRIKQRAVEIETAATAIGAGLSDQAKAIREVRGAFDRIGVAAKRSVKSAEDVTGQSSSIEELVARLSDLFERLHVAPASLEQPTRTPVRERAKLALARQSNSS